MSQTPQPSDDDLRLTDDEIRALSQDLRRQYVSDDRGVAGTVGKAVANNLEGLIRRLLLLFRLPLVLLAGLAGFIVVNGREGVSFFVAVAAGIVAAVLGAAIHGGLIRLIDMRAYRREIGH